MLSLLAACFQPHRREKKRAARAEGTSVQKQSHKEHWVFGAVEPESGRCAFGVPPRGRCARNKRNLTAFLEENVQRETALDTDKFAALNKRELAKKGFYLSTTNHSRGQWVDYETTDTCGRPRHNLTQEALWGRLRKFTGNYNLQRQQTAGSSAVLMRYLDEFEVKHNERWFQEGKFAFLKLLLLIAEVHEREGWKAGRRAQPAEGEREGEGESDRED